MEQDEDIRLGENLIKAKIPQKLVELLHYITTNDQLTKKTLLTIRQMLCRNDQFSDDMRQAFIDKTDIINMCDQIATTFEKQEGIFTLAIKLQNKFLKDQQVSDDEELYNGSNFESTRDSDELCFYI